MKRNCLCVLLLLLVFQSGCSPGLGNSSLLGLGEELQVTLDSAREAGGLIGVSAAMIDAEGNVWTGVSGISHPGQPITRDMLFDMGSSGKNLTAALMLDLAEDGLISLDDPMEVYIDPPPGVDGSIPIRMLLNHTSGLANMVEHPESPFRTNYQLIDFERWWEIDEIFTELGQDPYFLPGAGWHYSQAGYQIATLIVEEVTGSSTAEEIQSRLLDPLGIEGMILDFSQPVAEDKVIAHGWVDLYGHGIPSDISDRSRNWIASLSRNLYYTNAEDLARWGHKLFSGQVLESESLEQMLDFYRPDDFGNEPPVLTGYGLGVVEWKPFMLNGYYGYGHSGSIPGYRAFMAYLPEEDLTIAVLSNSDKEEELGALIQALIQVAIGPPPEEAAIQPIEVNPLGAVPMEVESIQVFSRQELFCNQNTNWEYEASASDWIDVGFNWLVAAAPELMEEIWPNHNHELTINGIPLENLADFENDMSYSAIDCGDQVVEFWARGFTVYLPPLPEGEYEIVWRSDVIHKFHNGFVEYRSGDYLEARARLKVSS